MSGGDPLLEVTGLAAGYGGSRVLHDLSLSVDSGEVVALIGRNGMGKTTTISAIMGIIRPDMGVIRFEGQQIHGLPPFRIAKRGIALVPEGRQVFPNLTVQENLIATAANRSEHPEPWTLERVLNLFPALATRLRSMAGVLSGGEQQMLAIGRALMTNPQLLILDEATEGLAPRLRREIWSVLEGLKALGQSILIVDKNARTLARVAGRQYILEKGRVAWSGTSEALLGNRELQRRYLGV